MSKYIVRFNDGSADELVVADRVFPDNGVFTFQKTVNLHTMMVSETVKLIPMHRVNDVEFVMEVNIGKA